MLADFESFRGGIERLVPFGRRTRLRATARCCDPENRRVVGTSLSPFQSRRGTDPGSCADGAMLFTGAGPLRRLRRPSTFGKTWTDGRKRFAALRSKPDDRKAPRTSRGHPINAKVNSHILKYGLVLATTLVSGMIAGSE